MSPRTFFTHFQTEQQFEGTAQVVEEKNSDVYDQIEAAYSENPTKAGPARESSKKVREKSNQLVEEIESIKPFDHGNRWV